MRVSLVAAASLLFLAARAIAQDGGGHHGHGHASNHDSYQKLMQPGTTYSCCHDEDCRPTRAFQDENGFWHAQLDGNWVTVPNRALLKDLAPDGNSHICASKGGYIFCFIGGSPKS